MPLRYVELDFVANLAALGPYYDCGKNIYRFNSVSIACLTILLPGTCRHKITLSLQVEGGDSKLFYAGVFDGHGKLS